MNKSDYHEYAGHVVNGPSRETLFDSLRLGVTTRFEFVFSSGMPNPLNAVVTGIKKNTPIVELDFDNWIIEILIQGNGVSGKKGKTYQWSGHYSTYQREGRIIGELPVCLISK